MNPDGCSDNGAANGYDLNLRRGLLSNALRADATNPQGLPPVAGAQIGVRRTAADGATRWLASRMSDIRRTAPAAPVSARVEMPADGARPLGRA